MSHPTPMELVRQLGEDELEELMALCPEEPADPDNCVACAAYMEAQARENPKEPPAWVPNVRSTSDGSTARYVGPCAGLDYSVIENEDGQRFGWANTEFEFIDPKENQ